MMNNKFFYESFHPPRFSWNIHVGSEDIGVGYPKSLGVLSRNARQETGSAAFIRCQRSPQRGPEEVSKQIASVLPNQSTICLLLCCKKRGMRNNKSKAEIKFLYHRYAIYKRGSSNNNNMRKNQLISSFSFFSTLFSVPKSTNQKNSVIF